MRAPALPGGRPRQPAGALAGSGGNTGRIGGAPSGLPRVRRLPICASTPGSTNQESTACEPVNQKRSGTGKQPRAAALGGINNVVPAPRQGSVSNVVPAPGQGSVQATGVPPAESLFDAAVAHVDQQLEGAVQAGVAAAAAEAAQEIINSGGGGGGGGGGSGSRSSVSADRLEGMHKPVGLVLGSAWLLATSVQLAGVAALTPLWLPALAGGLLGGLGHVALNHVGPRRLWRAPKMPLRVVVTGGTSGIGKALAREFLKSGDRVLVTSRTAAGAAQAVEQLRQEVGPEVDVAGVECDVSDPASVDRLMAAAQERLGGIDCLVNNAGYSGSFKSLVSQPAEQIEQVVRTNLLGSLLVTRAAMRLMAAQPGGGHVFNMEGAGSDGAASPQYAAYGATKAGLAQLLRTLQHEAAELGPNPVCAHNLSPGMVLTDLLLEGATLKNKQVFNILCEHPETVAAFLVPRTRSVVANRQAGAAIRYLTPGRVLAKLAAAPFHAGRYFDDQGRPVYLPERERIYGDHKRRTARLQARAARRSGPMQVAYSFSMALAFWLIVSDAMAKAPLP